MHDFEVQNDKLKTLLVELLTCVFVSLARFIPTYTLYLVSKNAPITGAIKSLFGVDSVRWTVDDLILRPFGVLHQHAVGHARRH